MQQRRKGEDKYDNPVHVFLINNLSVARGVRVACGVSTVALPVALKVDRRWNGTAQGAQGPVERRMQEFGPIGGLVVGAFGEASADVLTLIQRTALFNAERNGLWRCMGASSLEDGAKVLEKRAIRTLGVEGVRGLARARLANLSHVCSNYRQSGPNRGREKAYYENARQAHYERFGPRAYYKSGRRQHSS